MRSLLLASASVILLGGTALAQNSNSPLSNTATHITPSDTHSEMSPRLPVSADDATVSQFLKQAHEAVSHGHTGAAQEALERAETRLLSRSTDPSQASAPDSDAKVRAITMARDDLSRGDRKGALQSIEAAMSTASTSPVASSAGTPATSTPATTTAGPVSAPWPAPAKSPDVPPNSMGGIAQSMGGDNGTGVGTQSRPQASFSGPATPPTLVPETTSGGPATTP